MNNFECIYKSIADDCMKGDLETWKECKGCDAIGMCDCCINLDSESCKECDNNSLHR